MSKRFVIWCGVARNLNDAYASENDIRLALRVARALGFSSDEVVAFVTPDVALPREIALQRDVPTLARLRRFSSSFTEKHDEVIFLATDHGDLDGLACHSEFDPLMPSTPELLTPDVLGDVLMVLGSMALAIIGTCHSGTMLAAHRATVEVFTACPREERIIWSRDGGAPHTPFVRQFFESLAGVALDPMDDGPLTLSQPRTLSHAIWKLLEGVDFPGPRETKVRACWSGSKSRAEN